MILLSDIQIREAGLWREPSIIRVQSAGLFLGAVSQHASSPHRPRGANLCLLLDDSSGSSTLHPLPPLLGLTREEEGNILLFLTIVLTLPF